jgi:hypothetical protein
VDPITIGLAFTAAQSAVGYIKQAIALGKDVHSLSGQFSNSLNLQMPYIESDQR